jgi:hypothetical protein
MCWPSRSAVIEAQGNVSGLLEDLLGTEGDDDDRAASSPAAAPPCRPARLLRREAFERSLWKPMLAAGLVAAAVTLGAELLRRARLS